MSSSEEDEDCKLGRHEYWEATYATELANLEEMGDEGEIWFGEDVLETMAAWTDTLLQERVPDAHDVSILDLGTGNGSFLFRMAAMGYRDLHGSDYSAQSIALAKEIAKRRNVSNIKWIQDDLLDCRILSRFAVLTDKGTLDAVGLMADSATHRATYKRAAWNILHDNGLLIITSCNSTAQELMEEFCKSGNHQFRLVDKVKTYPTFKFGGVEGTKVCTLAFEKI